MMVTESLAADESIGTTPQQAATPPVRRENRSVAEVPAARQHHPFWLPFAVTAIATIVLVGFIAIARVPIGAGWREGRALPVREIWFLFTQELRASLGWLSPGPITVLVIAILAGCLLALWLAVAVTDEPPEPRDD